MFQAKERLKVGTRWVLKNEVRPVDLYCYFGARFGAPNGIQNFLRSDESDNLVHWEWFLRAREQFISVQGMNFRTEVWIFGPDRFEDVDKSAFVAQLKEQFAQCGADMGKVRKSLEHWAEFVNPYQRLRRAVKQLLDELSSLGIDVENDAVPDFAEHSDSKAFEKAWRKQADKYSRAIGLCFGVRSMLPVMAEAFVNLLLYFLMKPELKSDDRLRENAIRQPIDIRIRSLPHNCMGFRQSVDYGVEACKRYHTLVNERNDLLHGNVVIDKLRFNELYFNGKVPVFMQYSTMWERTLGVAHRSVGLESVREELAVVDGLIQYLLSCLDDKTRAFAELIANKFDLGVNLKDGRLGILFPDHLVDLSPMSPPSEGKEDGSTESDEDAEEHA